MTVLSPFLRLSLPLLGLLNLLAVGTLPASCAELEQEVPAALQPSPADSGAVLALASLTHPKASTPSDAELELLARLDEYNNVGKRAYSYVSEYKRLPVYNFGLGKRSKSQLYSFGLGKRSPGGRTYSFGLGKRDADDADDSESLVDEQEGDDDDGDEIGENNEIDTSAEEEDEMMEKRNKLYSFGLGKRAKPYGFGLGKRYPGEVQRLYSFGLGKRARPEMYSFGLGKRGDSSRLYSFGLGKRPSQNQNSRFNFGLGKRSYDEGVDDASAENAKRTLAERRFSFGLGKREVSESELKEVGDETKRNESAGAQEHAIAKRSLHYGFGLGKRSRYGSQEEPSKAQGDMMRFARRPYSFGLGKRAPLYDFGMGKRADG